MLDGTGSNDEFLETLKSTGPRVCAKTDQVSHEIVSEIQAAVPQLAADAAMASEIAAAAEATLRQFFAMLREEVDPARAQLTPEMTRLTREFVHRGVDLTAVLHTLRIGHAVIWRRWLEVLRTECKDPILLGDALGLASELQFAYVNALSTQAAEEYRSEREHWARSADAVRVSVLNAILDEEQVDLAIASSRLGYELRREHLALMLWTQADPAEAPFEELRGAVQAMAATAGCPRPLVIPMGDHLLAAWMGGSPAPAPRELEAIARGAIDQSGVHMSVGTVGDDVAGFRRSHQEAMWARGVATRARATARLVVRYDEVALAAIALAAEDQSCNFVSRELGLLAGTDPDTRRLASTLRVYLDEGSSLDRAARRLGVHKNTVLNRVKRARELLGRGLDERTLELQVALAFARFREGSLRDDTECAASTHPSEPTGS